MIKVMIADDQELMRESLQILLSTKEDIEICALAKDGEEVLALVAKEQPDVILMDIRMPQMNGVQCTKQIKEMYPKIAVIVLTTFDDDEYIYDALKYGASSYLLKGVSLEELYQAILTVVNGGGVIQPQIAIKAMRMFSDMAKIYVKAGDGGNGAVTFHREKYVAAGGPDGGDGGKGGNVILVADKGVNTLIDFRYKRKFAAENGGGGKDANRNGKCGEDLTIKVPVGTIVRDCASDRVICDLKAEGQSMVAAKGGIGGWGNAHFANATRQTPKFAKPGAPGDEREITLELKLIADVGLLGFPNVGKSTFLSMVSDARPKIANYHFTTLKPNLGVVNVGDGGGFVIADIPGIIEGA